MFPEDRGLQCAGRDLGLSTLSRQGVVLSLHFYSHCAWVGTSGSIPWTSGGGSWHWRAQPCKELGNLGIPWSKGAAWTLVCRVSQRRPLSWWRPRLLLSLGPGSWAGRRLCASSPGAASSGSTEQAGPAEKPAGSKKYFEVEVLKGSPAWDKKAEARAQNLLP